VTTTTFGYNAAQDRIWMRVHDQDSTVWFTRRMVISIFGTVLPSFEASTPGEQGGASPRARASIEHDLSLHEAAPGQRPPQIRAGHESPGSQSDPQERLCQKISTQTSSLSVNMTFDTSSGPLVLRLSRKGTHLWFQGLAMVLRQARWNLPDALPDWLQAGVLPPAMQVLISKPLPDNLDGD